MGVAGRVGMAAAVAVRTSPRVVTVAGIEARQIDLVVAPEAAVTMAEALVGAAAVVAGRT